MHPFIERTWKPTLAIALLSWIIAGAAFSNGPIVAVPAVVMTPIVWWLLVARKDHPVPRDGAIAGAVAAVAAQILPILFVALWFSSVRPYGGPADLVELEDRMAGLQIIGAMAGAALGSVIGSMLVRGRLPRATSH